MSKEENKGEIQYTALGRHADDTAVYGRETFVYEMQGTTARLQIRRRSWHRRCGVSVLLAERSLTFRLSTSSLREDHRGPRRSSSPSAPLDDHRYHDYLTGPTVHASTTPGNSSRQTMPPDPSMGQRLNTPQTVVPGQLTGVPRYQTASPLVSQSPLSNLAALPQPADGLTTSPRYEALSTTYPKPHDR
jgi:hypothetical protein